ncbi:MAG: hypothetical protein KH268_00355 [Clostridiales bacterium]|nr:hypothetical protein [Clostridiales bacterium]
MVDLEKTIRIFSLTGCQKRSLVAPFLPIEMVVFSGQLISKVSSFFDQTAVMVSLVSSFIIRELSSVFIERAIGILHIWVNYFF